MAHDASSTGVGTEGSDQSDPLVADAPGSGSEPIEGTVLEPESSPVAEADYDPLLADSAPATPDGVLASERLLDLQRLQAEYVNYKRRVERDRSVAGDQAASRVIESLLPVMDDIYLARQHGDLEGGPFAAIADKLDATIAKQGVERFGEPGEPFDPTLHEALMHTEAELAEGTASTTVVQVFQPGYRIGDRVIRAARVAVADPK